jgi:cytoskeletal protein RodZ
MTDELKKMGEKFRRLREEMSLTLKEVENATSIRMSYLQAIEEGRVEHILSNVYALGFIRQYAGFLGIETSQLQKEYPEAMRLPAEKQDFAYGIGTLEMRGNPHGNGKLLPAVIWGSAGVLFILCVFYFMKFLGIF